MKKLYKHHALFLLPLLPLLVAACHRQEQPEALSGPVGFAVREEIPDFQTKAAEIYRSSDSTPLKGDDIAVWAYNLPAQTSPVSAYLVDGGSASGAVKASYDSKYKYWGTSVSYNTSKRPASYYTRWFAVAPWSVLGGGATLAAFADGTAPTLSYTVPAAAASQHDLMTAVSGTYQVYREDKVALTFTHALTGVRIMADKGTPVTAATISGVYDTGTLNLMSGEWSSHAKSVATHTFSLDLSSSELWDSSGSYDVVKDAGTLLLLPQWLPQGAKLSVTVSGVTIETDLSGHKWLPGKLVTYFVQGYDKEYHISVEEEYAAAVSLTAGVATDVAKIRSYYTPVGGSAQSSAGWTVKGVYSTSALAAAGGDGDLSWTAEIVGGAAVGADHDVLRVTASYGASSASATVTDLLQAAPERGTSGSPWNLSNPDGGDAIVETANTYLIDAPGYYRLPLVLGNGIKAGAANSAAYPSSFVDYKGAAITSPYLHSSSTTAGTPTSPELVWTETSGMLEDLAIQHDAGLYWLTFRIQASNIAQGCTVVSVKDGDGMVMWSWLLWATDYELGSGDVTCTNATFMPRNLGWSVEGNVTFPAAVDAWVRVQSQQDDSVYALVHLYLPHGKVTSTPYAGHGPYFQWGRKDAFPPPGMTVTYVNSGSRRTVADMIKNPLAHCDDSRYPLRENATPSWWSANANAHNYTGPTVKTIYDPSPAGYTVPRSNAFGGYSSKNWDGTNNGYVFNYSAGSLFLPAIGRRQPNNNAQYSNDHTGYWVAVSKSNNMSQRLNFSNSTYNEPSTSDSGSQTKAGEYAIRPAREQ